MKLKTSYISEYKVIVGALKKDTIRPVEWLGLQKSFQEFAGDKYIEPVTKVKKEWFTRLSKGLGYLGKFKREVLMYMSIKKSQEANIVKLKYTAAKARVMEIVKARKAEYSTRKFF